MAKYADNTIGNGRDVWDGSKERKRRRRTKDEIRPARSVAFVAVYSGPSPMDGTRDTGSSLMRCGSSPPHFVV